MTNLSYWESDSYFKRRDIIIIGGGFVGLWSAIELKTRKPHLEIAVLDKGIIPTGASTRNAGFSCFGSPSELLGDAALIGEANMWQLVEWRYKGLQKIRQYFSPEQIDYMETGGYECYKTVAEAEECRAGLEWLNEGLRRITGKDEVFGFAPDRLVPLGLSGFEDLSFNSLEGGLHPAKLVLALQQRAQQLGVQLFTGIDVTSFEENGGCIQVETEQRLSFQAERLLVCNNAFAKALLPQLEITPARGQVLLTAPVEGLKLNGSFHYDHGFYYFRNLNGRVLLGGARNKSIETENTTSFVTTNLIQKDLEQFLQQHILNGQPYTVTDRWAGIMGLSSTTDKLPVIRQVKAGVYCAVRMSGMGLALAPVAAEVAAGLMLD